jgi:hypothetical protein
MQAVALAFAAQLYGTGAIVAAALTQVEGETVEEPL